MTFIKNNSYVFVIIILCAGFAIMGVSKYGKEKTFAEITITEGDTLWELALHYSDNIPTHQWIKEVMVLNNLSTSTIKQGEELLLPTVHSVGINKYDTQLAGNNR